MYYFTSGNGSFRPRVVSALSRFGPGSFRPGSIRPGSIQPWVVSAQFGGSFHDILICSAWFLFYLIKPRQTRHIVVGGWLILSSVYLIILVCVLSDRSIEGKPQRTFLLNSLDNIIIQASYILVGVTLYGQQK